ncbi:cupin domain-containing protein [Streptomyces sp. NPDC016562]|uniref:cupin domain-containing protein n=1 Tax=Streptomyces sp. NPDC016562 TaxID=3364966 RepID=UPI00370135E6
MIRRAQRVDGAGMSRIARPDPWSQRLCRWSTTAARVRPGPGERMPESARGANTGQPGARDGPVPYPGLLGGAARRRGLRGSGAEDWYGSGPSARGTAVDPYGRHRPVHQCLMEFKTAVPARRCLPRRRAGQDLPMGVISPLVQHLRLEPHPEGGWFRRTWQTVPEALMDTSRGSRPCATAIYYLLHPGETSRWHRVRSDELWLWHRGGPLTLRVGGTGTTPDKEPAATVVGPDIESGQQPQFLVPSNVWQTATPAGDEPTLVSCVVAPGFDYDDLELL